MSFQSPRTRSSEFERRASLVAVALCLLANGCASAVEERSEAAGDGGAVDTADPETDECPSGMICDGPGEAEDAVAHDDTGAMEDAGTDTADPGGDATSTDTGAADAKTPDVKPIDSGPTAPSKPTCANVDQRLRDDFGIIIKTGVDSFEGMPGEDLACADRINVYEMFVKPFGYERYERLMKISDPFTLRLYHKSSSTGCSAVVTSADTVRVRNLKECMGFVSGPSDPDFERIAMFLIHESGHVLRARNPSVGSDFLSAKLYTKDPGCYDGTYLKTYSLRSGVLAFSESLSESMGLFIVNHKVNTLGTIKDFKKECPNSWAWVQKVIFNDTPL